MPWQEEGGITNNQGNFVDVNPGNHFIGSRNQGGHIRFHTQNGGGNQGNPNPAAEVMRLTDGVQGRNVGIGPFEQLNKIPSSKLHIDVPASPNPISALTVDVESFGTPANAQASHFFRVRDIGAAPPNGFTHFVIRGDGNVGMGTPDPVTLTQGRVLHINNPGGPSALRLGDGAANGEQWEWQSTVIAGVGGAMNLSKVSPPAFNPLTVLANGNVGIGTTTPQTTTGGRVLHIDNQTGVTALRLGGGRGQWEWQATAAPNDPRFPAMSLGDLRSDGSLRRVLTASNGQVWIGPNPTPPFPEFGSTLVVDGSLSVAGRVDSELFLGNIRTSISGFDGARFHWIRSNGDENDMWMAFAYPGGGTTPNVKRIMVAVDMYGPRFQVLSDARTKTNIQRLGGVLDKLERIRGVAFDWTESPHSVGCVPGQAGIGVTAQEVEAVFPELVSMYNDQGYKAVDYSGLTSVMLEAAKELKAQNEELRSRIEALERAA